MGEIRMDELNVGLRIDLGCGSCKKEGTLGIDIAPAPGVDYVLNIETDTLPFADRSVSYVHSSHFLEHTREPSHIFAEISRVCADGARVELWTPYAWSNPAFVSDHKFFFTEDIYLHICSWYTDFWHNVLGDRWLLHEFQYVVDAKTLCYLKAKNISLDFALRHMHNTVTEFGTFITVMKADANLPSPPLKRTFSTSRYAQRYEVRVDSDAPLFGENPSAVNIDASVEEAIRAFAKV
jgi:SAM-dependent methyltransferase